MKKLVSIVAILASISVGAQNWVFQPGTGYLNYPVHRFWNDTVNNRLLGVGIFDSIGGIYSPGFAQWDGTAWGTTGTEIYSGPYCATFGCITGYNSDIILAGGFSTWPPRNYIVRWNGSTFDSIGASNHGAVSMIQYQGDLIIGIAFMDDTINGTPFTSVARWDGTSWYDMGFGQIQGAIQSMAVYRDTLYLGAYSTIDQYQYVFRYVNNSWEQVGPRFYGAVYNLCVYNDELYAGSYNSGNNQGKAISKYDATTDQWIAPGGGIFSSLGYSEVESMAVMEGRLYAMGDFNYAGGVPADRIAAWDGTEWCGLGNGLTWGLRQIVAYDSSIYISTGNIFDGDTSTLFVEWVGDNYSDTCGIFDGVEETISNSSVSVYPNPASDAITLQFSGVRQLRVLVVYDAFGKEVWQGETSESVLMISVQEFSEGIYFYSVIEEGGKSANGKFLIQ